MHFWAAFLTTFGEIVYVIKVVRAPLIVSLIAGVALLVPDQTREVYRILAQPWRAYGYVQLCFAVVAVVFATFVPLIVARHLTFRHAKSVLQERSLAGGLSRWLPRMCGALIPLGLAFGLLIASSEMAFELPKPVIDASPSLAQLRADALGVASSLKWSSALCYCLLLLRFLTVPRRASVATFAAPRLLCSASLSTSSSLLLLFSHQSLSASPRLRLGR